MLGGGGETWDCTQRAGEVVFVPAGFLHATVNLDESVAVAIQCDDGVDPRTGAVITQKFQYAFVNIDSRFLSYYSFLLRSLLNSFT
tara:strand:- start:169 stop:426 length:258 start_codon:yes stop_codon:yes gene_type:complete